jgi:hypothetical protein
VTKALRFCPGKATVIFENIEARQKKFHKMLDKRFSLMLKLSFCREDSDEIFWR